MTSPRSVLLPGQSLNRGFAVQPLAPNKKSSLFGPLLVAIYIFLITGRLLDVSPLWVLHIPLLLLITLTILTIARGNFQYSFDSKLTKYFAAFTGWVIVCFPFSSWRFASMPSMQLQVQCLVIFLIVVQAVKTRRDWEQLASAYAYAILVAALLTFYIGVNIEGRISLPNGTLGDPNEFALHMVLGLPFWWFKASRSKGLWKIINIACTLPIYFAFARAGSRAGLLALGVLLLLTFLFAEGGRKVLIATVMVAGVAASSFVLPGYLKTRFLTFFSPAEGSFDAATQSRIASDIASSEERKRLLMQSLSMTVRHPVVGVGPGTFSFVSRDERIANGELGGENLVTHNTYTQISSECGLPGFFFFAATVFMAVRYTYSDYHRLIGRDRELAHYARYAFTALAGMAVGIFFLSVGYTHLLGVMFALALSLHNVIETEEKAAGVSAKTRSTGPQSRGIGYVPGGGRHLEPRFAPHRFGQPRNQFPTLPSGNRR